MSILVKGMKMPETCIKCSMQFGGWCYVSPPEIDERVAPTVDEAVEQGKPDWCPLVEVPTPHGRLIDAKPLTENIADTRLIGHEMDGTPIYATYGVFTSIPVNRVYDAPTIIEAEE